MSKIFKGLKAGLEDAIAHKKGKLKLKTKSFDKYLEKRLKPEEIKQIEWEADLEYLNLALKDLKWGMFAGALKKVLHKRGITITELHKLTGVNRSTLYRYLSMKGNPPLLFVLRLLRIIGLHFTVTFGDNTVPLEDKDD